MLKWWFLFFLVMSCGAPALDATGRIRCSDEGPEGCPPGFVLRHGRACPANSTEVECPHPAGDVGSGCVTGGCLPGLQCLQEANGFPGGYCSLVDCRVGDACGSLAQGFLGWCVPSPNGSDTVCLEMCTPTADGGRSLCRIDTINGHRVEYVCRPLPDADGTIRRGVCVPP